MVNWSLAELARDLRARRVVGDRPPVVLLGAGASVESGIGAMTDLFQFVNVANFEEFSAYIKGLNAAERFRLLSRFLQSQKPADVTPGYQALAALCADAYFDLILTTNLDPLLDDALAAARMWRRDYLLIINGVIRPDRLKLLLSGSSPRVRVIKLHGDLFHRFMAWTPEEMDAYVTDIHKALQPVLDGRDVLVVGHSLRDERIREMVLKAGGAIYYTNPKAVPDFLAKQENLRAVIGEEAAFEKFFNALANALGIEAPSESLQTGPVQIAETPAPAKGVQTVDDLMASVVGLATPQGFLSGTGFVLAEPRVIVTDRFVTDAIYHNKGATIVAAGNRRFETRIVRRNKTHPFGPVLLQVPDDLKVPGFNLDARPVEKKLAVRIGVAAGERTCISSGVIENPKEVTLNIAPIGKVSRLVPVNAVVAQGSSGAPVVDETFAVRGFIVAGRTDAPPSYMFPVSAWANLLKVASRAGSPSKAKSNRRPRSK